MRSLLFVMQFHDDVIKWKHSPRYWPFVLGNHRSPVNSRQKGPWINGCANNRETGDLRRHRTHFDITLMCPQMYKSGVVVGDEGISLALHPLWSQFTEVPVSVAEIASNTLWPVNAIWWQRSGSTLVQVMMAPSDTVRQQFYHDVDEICWPQPIKSLKLGYVTGQWSMSPTWVGRENSFQKL